MHVDSQCVSVVPCRVVSPFLTQKRCIPETHCVPGGFSTCSRRGDERQAPEVASQEPRLVLPALVTMLIPTHSLPVLAACSASPTPVTETVGEDLSLLGSRADSKGRAPGPAWIPCTPEIPVFPEACDGGRSATQSPSPTLGESAAAHGVGAWWLPACLLYEMPS